MKLSLMRNRPYTGNFVASFDMTETAKHPECVAGQRHLCDHCVQIYVKKLKGIFMVSAICERKSVSLPFSIQAFRMRVEQGDWRCA